MSRCPNCYQKWRNYHLQRCYGYLLNVSKDVKPTISERFFFLRWILRWRHPKQKQPQHQFRSKRCQGPSAELQLLECVELPWTNVELCLLLNGKDASITNLLPQKSMRSGFSKKMLGHYVQLSEDVRWWVSCKFIDDVAHTVLVSWLYTFWKVKTW